MNLHVCTYVCNQAAVPTSSQPPSFCGPHVVAEDNPQASADTNDMNTSSLTADDTVLLVRPAGSSLGSDQSSPVHYFSEGRGNLSSRTSLSALTCDDGEHVGLCRQPRSLPLGQEQRQTTASNTSALPEPETTATTTVDVRNLDFPGIDDKDSVDDVDGMDSPVNEEDERRLAECINLGMPPRRRKGASKKAVQGSTDGDQLQQQSGVHSSKNIVMQCSPDDAYPQHRSSLRSSIQLQAGKQSTSNKTMLSLSLIHI